MIASFCGTSGQAYSFERVAPNSDWAKRSGLVLFAAPDAYGWRVVKVIDCKGTSDNLQAVWDYREAQRYGACAVFLRDVPRDEFRAKELSDLQRGLSPVCEANTFAMAA